MKWLWRTVKFFALALLVTAFGLRVAGKRSGANHMQASLEIAKPPAEVWDWVSEPEKLKQWVSWLIEARLDDVSRRGAASTAASRG